jgi:nicastrin
MIDLIPSNSPLPPASSQIFLRQTSSSSFPAYILSSADENQLANHYYHSFFDDPSTLSINISTLEYDSTTEFSQWIKRIVEPLAQTLIESFVGIKKIVTIKQEIIDNLVYCILKNINCPLIHNVTNQSVGNTFQSFNETSMPFTINTYPTSITPTFPFIQYVLSYFLRDRSYDSQNLTETSCRKRANNDRFCSYTYVGGYLPSINNEQSFSGYCVRSYIRSASSTSPAFVMKNYDLSQTTYPAWTESRWTIISLRLFIIPTRIHEIITLVIGISLFFISFLVLFLLRYYTKISLLQPSSS